MPLRPDPDNPDLMVFVKHEYPPPKEWQGLTDEELRDAYVNVCGKEWCLGGMDNAEVFYDAIEAKLKEKNA